MTPGLRDEAGRRPPGLAGDRVPVCLGRPRARDEEAPLLSFLSGISIHVLIVGIPGLLAAIVLHEVAHALVSTWLGDPTPGLQGRLSLNPLVHIDWIGMLMLAVFKFGWAKPVQIDPRYYRNQRLGMVLVAVAGPAMNVLIGVICLALLWHLQWPTGRIALGPVDPLALPWPGPALLGATHDVLAMAVLYNVFFAVFNILPVPPLDGSRILASVSREGARIMAAIEPYGWVALLLLVFTGLINGILLPMTRWLLGLIALLAGVPTM